MASTAPRRALLLALLVASAAGEMGARAAHAANAANTADAADAAETPRPVVPAGVEGWVTAQSSPLSAAGVYAYQLADLTLQKVTTDAQGRFLFHQLPAGLYKIIAHKTGFMPAIVLLTRTTALAHQKVKLELSRDLHPAPAAEGDDFWSVRASLPADVLREIERSEGQVQVASLVSESAATPAAAALAAQAALGQFRTEMQAMTGVDQIAAAGDSQVAGGRLGIAGHLGGTQVGLQGRFWQLDSPGGFATRGTEPFGVGQASAVRLDLARGAGSRVQINSLNNRLVTRGEGFELPVDLEHYGVRWTQAVGENGRSELSAQYTSENNFHRQAAFDPADIPGASRTWKVEGSYTASLGAGSTLQTGIRYRERQIDLGSPGMVHALDGPAQSNLDLFGRGGVRVDPSVLLEYGLFSTLSDGSVAVTPRGGVVLQLGERWQLAGSASRRVYREEGRLEQDFLPTLYGEGDLCEDGGEACYELLLTRNAGEDNGLTLGAVRRTVGKTLRLYFSEDFFDRFESLYLVPGDQLPELHLSVHRRLSPQLIAKLESRLASGGGGTFHGGDGRTYENQVRYMVTSLDTKYQRTETGVFIAFHRLSQQLDPLGAAQAESSTEVERLQLLLTQDLNILFDLAADWAVQLNMELSRGGVSATQAAAADPDDIRRRFLGGIAVKF